MESGPSSPTAAPSTVALFGGSPMVQGLLGRLLSTQGIALVVDPVGPLPPGAVGVVAPEGEPEDELEARVVEAHGQGLPVLLLLREVDRELAGRAWPVAGVVLRPARAPVLLAALRALSAGVAEG